MIGLGTVLIVFGAMLCLSPVLHHAGVGFMGLGLALVLIGLVDRAFRRRVRKPAGKPDVAPAPAAAVAPQLDYALYTPFAAGEGSLDDAARAALIDAKKAGYAISSLRNEAIVLRRGEEEVLFRSNADVIEWGRKNRP